MVVRLGLGLLPVVAEVASDEHRQEIGRRHARCRMTGAGAGAGPDRIDPQLPGELRHRGEGGGGERRAGGVDALASAGGAPDHGAYLNGWRNASAALTGGTTNAICPSDRMSKTTIWVCPVSRSHSSVTVRASPCRVSSSTNIEPPPRRDGEARVPRERCVRTFPDPCA